MCALACVRVLRLEASIILQSISSEKKKNPMNRVSSATLNTQTEIDGEGACTQKN